MRYFRYAFLLVIILGCGAPVAVGRVGQKNFGDPTHINTAAPTASLSEAVFIVTADSLQIRPCPYKDDLTCPPFERGFVAGDVVMGYCRTFEDGSIWLEFDGNKYAAVYFDEVWLMDGSCQ